MQPNEQSKSNKDKQFLRTNVTPSLGEAGSSLSVAVKTPWHNNFKALTLLAIVVAISSGALLTFAFAPASIWPLAILCPAILLLICQRAATEQHAFLYGELFGLGFFGSGLSWVYISLHTFGQANVVLASFMTLLMVLVLAIYIACACYVLKRFFSSSFNKPGHAGFSLLMGISRMATRLVVYRLSLVISWV